MDYDAKVAVLARDQENGLAPEDVQLESQLQGRLEQAQEAAERHSVELRRAQRVIASCRAGLEELQRPTEAPEPSY